MCWCIENVCFDFGCKNNGTFIFRKEQIELAPSKLITTPERYLILFWIINFTKFPISSGSPNLFMGNNFINSSIFSINSFVLSVLIGPGAILMQLIFFSAYSLLKILKTSLNAARYADEMINFGRFFYHIWTNQKIYPLSLILIFCKIIQNPKNNWLW